MLEENRQKALKEIDAQLEENIKLRNIVGQLNFFSQQRQYDKYIDLIIKEQPLLTKYYQFVRESHIAGVEGLRSIMIPDDNYTARSILEKYIDDNNPVFFHQVIIDEDNNQRYVYKNLETGEELTEEEYENKFGSNPAMVIEIENPDAFFNEYKTWYIRLLSQHTVEETYEILKKLSECENAHYRSLKKSSNTLED